MNRTRCCSKCGQPGRYVRTRNFLPEEQAKVWECRNTACPSYDLIWHTSDFHTRKASAALKLLPRPPVAKPDPVDTLARLQDSLLTRLVAGLVRPCRLQHAMELHVRRLTKVGYSHDEAVAAFWDMVNVARATRESVEGDAA